MGNKPVCSVDAYGRKQCTNVPAMECNNVPKEKGWDEPKQECQYVPREECKMVPREYTEYRKECHTEYKEVTNYKTEQKCNQVPRQKTEYKTEQECTTVYEKQCNKEVCKSAPEEKCTTGYKQECKTVDKAVTYTAPEEKCHDVHTDVGVYVPKQHTDNTNSDDMGDAEMDPPDEGENEEVVCSVTMYEGNPSKMTVNTHHVMQCNQIASKPPRGNQTNDNGTLIMMADEESTKAPQATFVDGFVEIEDEDSRGKICHRRFQAHMLVDTGQNVRNGVVVSADICEKLNLSRHIVPLETQFSVTGANSSKLEIQGKLIPGVFFLSFNSQGDTFGCCPIVIKGLAHPVNIGVEFLTNIRASVNLKSRKLVSTCYNIDTPIVNAGSYTLNEIP